MAKLPPCKDCKERHTVYHDYCWKCTVWTVDDVIKPKELPFFFEWIAHQMRENEIQLLKREDPRMDMGRNSEHYSDPTPGTAWENMRREEKRLDAARLTVVSDLVPILRQTAELAGFEIIGRIPLRDKATGKEYR